MLKRSVSYMTAGIVHEILQACCTKTTLNIIERYALPGAQARHHHVVISGVSIKMFYLHGHNSIAYMLYVGTHI